MSQIKIYNEISNNVTSTVYYRLRNIFHNKRNNTTYIFIEKYANSSRNNDDNVTYKNYSFIGDLLKIK